jgi:hypothetical protein
LGGVRAVPCLSTLCPGICLTTEEKHGKSSVRIAEKVPVGTMQCARGHLASNQDQLSILISPYWGKQVDTSSAQMSAKLLK